MTGDVISVSAVSPDGKGKNVECMYVSLPCETGSVGVLANHAPMLCALTKGSVVCKKASGEQEIIPVSGGVAQVYKNTVTILLS